MRIAPGEHEIRSPKCWGSAQPGMSWHHIIPFALLREVWNRLVDQQITTEFPDARVAIHRYLLLSNPALPSDEKIARMRSENTRLARTRHHKLLKLEVHEWYELDQAAVWPVWNAVEGPGNRSDDPKDLIDHRDPTSALAAFDRFTSGLTTEEAVRMRAIEVLFSQLLAFVRAGAKPGPGSLTTLADELSAARRVIRCDLPIRYRPEMWVKEESGKFHKRLARDGENPAA